MADSNREDGSTPTSLQSGYTPFKGDQWKDADVPKRPLGNANVMPGGTANTAGGERVGDVNAVKAFQSITWEDWKALPTKPCVKDSLLTGIGSGFVFGGLRTVMRAPVASASNWAVGAFCFTAFSMYQYCTYQRNAEREGMKRAMEIIDRKAIERKQKEQRMERARELRRAKKEEEDQELFGKLRSDKEQSGSKPWYKVW